MRLIDADELIKCIPSEEYNSRFAVMNAITVEPSKWIPVSERLPEKYGQYLVTFVASVGTLWTYVIIAHYSDLMGIAKPSFHIGSVGKNDFQNITDGVVAWMPLPEPYKENKE